MKRILFITWLCLLGLGAFAQGGARGGGAGMFSRERGVRNAWQQPVAAGWQNTVLLSYELGVSPGGEFVTGRRFNPWLFVGVGVGYHFDYNTLYNYHHYNIENVQGYSYGYECGGFDTHRVPLYVRVGFYLFAERRVNLYLGLSPGIDFIAWQIHQADRFVGLGGHARAEAGVNIRLDGSRKAILLTWGAGVSPVSQYGPSVQHAFFTGGNIGFTF